MRVWNLTAICAAILLLLLPGTARALSPGDTVLVMISDGTACLGKIAKIDGGMANVDVAQENADDGYCQVIADEPFAVSTMKASAYAYSVDYNSSQRTTDTIFVGDRVKYYAEPENEASVCTGTVRRIANEFLLIEYDDAPSLRCKVVKREMGRYQRVMFFKKVE